MKIDPNKCGCPPRLARYIEWRPMGGLFRCARCGSKAYRPIRKAHDDGANK